MSRGKLSKMDDIFNMLDNLSFEAVDSLDHVLHNQECLFEAIKRIGEVVNDMVDGLTKVEEALLKVIKGSDCGGCGSNVVVEDKKDNPEIYA